MKEMWQVRRLPYQLDPEKILHETDDGWPKVIPGWEIATDWEPFAATDNAAVYRRKLQQKGD